MDDVLAAAARPSMLVGLDDLAAALGSCAGPGSSSSPPTACCGWASPPGEGAHVTKLLADAGLYVNELRAEAVSLEELFLELTEPGDRGGRGMNGPLADAGVEMRRALHRRLVRWMLALALALCALTGVIAYLSSGDPGGAGPLDRPSGAHGRLVDRRHGDGDSLLLMAAVFLAVGAAIGGASVAGAEWRAGTVTTVLTWEPSRLRLHAARTASAAILAFVIGIALEVAFLASVLPAVLLHGTTEGTDAAWWIGLVAAMARIALVTAIVAVLALNVATLGRNTSAALVAIAAWAFVVERTVAAVRPGLARFMIGENVATVVPWTPLTGVEFDRPPVVALATLVAYLAVIVAIATVSFAKRDVIGKAERCCVSAARGRR